MRGQLEGRERLDRRGRLDGKTRGERLRRGLDESALEERQERLNRREGGQTGVGDRETGREKCD